MNMHDLERMISLTDDRYINELFSDRITSSKRRPVMVFAGCAAAILAVMAGINILIDNSAEDISDLNQIRTEITVTESAMPYSGINGAENTDYSIYFKSEYFTWNTSYSPAQIGGRTYEITNDDIKGIVPFDDMFENGWGSATLYCDKDGNTINAYLNYHGPFGHNVFINMSSSGIMVSDIKGKPVKRHGVDVYGYDDEGYQTSDIIGRVLYFSTGGTEYYMRFSTDFEYEEAVKIMDSIILSGFSTADLDFSKLKWYSLNTNGGNISLSDANTLSLFAGYIPQIESIELNGQECPARLSFTDHYDKTEFDSQELYINYDTTDYSKLSETGSYTSAPVSTMLRLDYSTDKSRFEVLTNRISIDELSKEAIEKFEFEGVFSGEAYTACIFVIECGGFDIFVSSQKCPVDTLWNIVNQIRQK